MTDGYRARAVQWHETRFPNRPAERVALKLASEVGELCDAVIAKESGNEHPERADQIGAEAADVVIVLLVLLGRYYPEVDLWDEVDTKLSTLEKRLDPDTPPQPATSCEFCGSALGDDLTPYEQRVLRSAHGAALTAWAEGQARLDALSAAVREIEGSADRVEFGAATVRRIVARYGVEHVLREGAVINPKRTVRSERNALLAAVSEYEEMHSKGEGCLRPFLIARGVEHLLTAAPPTHPEVSADRKSAPAIGGSA
jgi:NTP pyrophosphatase (non-canonical NTP hydrolase)